MSEWLQGTYSRGSIFPRMGELQPGVVTQPLSFSLANPGDSVRGYKLSIQLYENGRWVSCPEWISITPDVFTTIYPAERQDVEESLKKGVATIRLAPPADLDWGGGEHATRVMVTTHETTFTADEAQHVDYYEFSLRIPLTYDVELSLEPERQSGAMEDTFWLSLRNRSNTAVELSFEAVDKAGALQFTFEPPRLELAQAKQGTVAVKVSARKPVIKEESRSHSFVITARLKDQPQIIWKAEGEWIQLPISLELKLSPGRVITQPGEEAVFHVQIKNLSEIALTVELEAIDPASENVFNFSPARLTLQPGQENEATLRVQGRIGVEDRGSRKTSFTVIAKTAGAPELQEEIRGSWERKAAPPPPTPTPMKRKGSSWGWIALGVVGLTILCILVYGGCQPDGPRPTEQPADPTDALPVSVPNVTNTSESEAKKILVEAGLNASIGDVECNDDFAPGIVIASTPAAKDLVEHNGTVNLVISEGPCTEVLVISAENVKDVHFVQVFREGSETIEDFAVSEDNSTLGLVSTSGLVELVRIPDRTVLSNFKVDRLLSADFSEDLKFLATGLGSGDIQLWDTNSGKQLFTTKPHSLGVTSITFSVDGAFLASGSVDKFVRVWRVKSSTLEELYSWDYHPDTIFSMAFESQNTLVNRSFKSPKLRFGSGKVEYVTQDQYTHGIEYEYDSGINNVLYSPDNKKYALAVGNLVFLWKNEYRFPRSNPIVLGEHEASVFHLAFSPDSEILVTGTGGRNIWIWDVESGELLYTIAGYFDAAFSYDGKMMFLYKENQGIELWQVTR